MKDKLSTQHHATFESIKQRDSDGNEYWLARELAPLLEYVQWRNFVQVIDKARTACRQAGNAEADHFADISKMVDIGSGAQRQLPDVGRKVRQTIEDLGGTMPENLSVPDSSIQQLELAKKKSIKKRTGDALSE